MQPVRRLGTTSRAQKSTEGTCTPKQRRYGKSCGSFGASFFTTNNFCCTNLQSLDTPYTIIEHFSKELFAGNSCTDVRVKQIIRRYVEADREVVVWVATITPIEIKRKAFTGLTSHHRNYAVIKRAKASTPERELSLLQLVAHVTLDTEEGTIYDPMYIRALTDFLLSNAAGNIKADQELIENVLMDQTLDQH
ncbi:hypothetical protein Pcac1_g10681 [Phytophthora cactorum]|nr:hypothetical protein Pcac1_g10681 [Phytophthora cactorum]